MKKQLVLKKKENDYILTMKDDENNNIKIIKKVINGEELYNAFYKSVIEKIEYEIVTELRDGSDKIIYNQLCDLFNKIDTEVNRNCFNKETGEE